MVKLIVIIGIVLGYRGGKMDRFMNIGGRKWQLFW